MADLNAILDSIKELKLLEVAELVKMMEDEFGVSAAAPVMVAGAADGAAAGGAEKSEFDVVLAEAGASKIDINGDVEMSDTDFLGEMYHFNEPVKVSGSVSNNGKSLILKANCTGHMTTQCARCMKDIVVDIDFDIDENLAQDDGSVSSDDDVILFEDVKIDIDDIVANNFLMNVEGKYLCSEDCKGLCQHCGADLNEGDCGCSQENIDPRWAALVDIMEKDK